VRTSVLATSWYLIVLRSKDCWPIANVLCKDVLTFLRSFRSHSAKCVLLEWHVSEKNGRNISASLAAWEWTACRSYSIIGIDPPKIHEGDRSESHLDTAQLLFSPQFMELCLGVAVNGNFCSETFIGPPQEAVALSRGLIAITDSKIFFHLTHT